MRRLLCFLLLGGLPAFGAPSEYHFAFGNAPVPAGWLPVTADPAYTTARGYGIEAGAAISATAGVCTSDRPFFFSMDLPEGNYRVTATLGDPAGASHNHRQGRVPPPDA